jgi:hypothetical protein
MVTDTQKHTTSVDIIFLEHKINRATMWKKSLQFSFMTKIKQRTTDVKSGRDRPNIYDGK